MVKPCVRVRTQKVSPGSDAASSDASVPPDPIALWLPNLQMISRRVARTEDLEID
jgi:hypothetical protein